MSDSTEDGYNWTGVPPQLEFALERAYHAEQITPGVKVTYEGIVPVTFETPTGKIRLGYGEFVKTEDGVMLSVEIENIPPALGQLFETGVAGLSISNYNENKENI